MDLKALATAFVLMLAFLLESIGQGSLADRRLFMMITAVVEKGDAMDQYELGLCYWDGIGVTKDVVEAAKWWRKAAEQGIVSAQNNLGVCYARGVGVSKDPAAAVRWYRQAAEQGNAKAQKSLGDCYRTGDGVAEDMSEALNWYRRAASQGSMTAQYNVGAAYAYGQGVAQDWIEAVRWYRLAAVRGDATSQYNLGVCYSKGSGVAQDTVEAAKLYRKAAEQGLPEAQFNLGLNCAKGTGVPKDCVQAYKWVTLAVMNGVEPARKVQSIVAPRLVPDQLAEAQRQIHAFKPLRIPESDAIASGEWTSVFHPASSGTAFDITEDGYFVTNEHVVKNSTQVRLLTSGALISAKVVKVDEANDLALLKAEGRFAALSIAASGAVKLGGTVATVGFPNIGLQGFAPKLAKGEIASLSGAGDDARYFQISVPVQPGNSGGALVDERGNVVGVVSAKLSARAALASSGSLPENVNYAVKSSFLLGFLESVPEVSAKLKEPNTKERKFEDVVKSAEQAAVLVLVY